MDIDIGEDFSGGRHVGIYTPVVDDASHEYGIAPKWLFWAKCPAWYTDTAQDTYDSATGTGYVASRTIYVGARGRSAANGVLLPRRVGVQLVDPDDPPQPHTPVEDTHIRPSTSVENLLDADGKYIYSLVVI